MQNTLIGVLKLLQLVAEHCFLLLLEMVWTAIQLVTLPTGLLIHQNFLIALISSYLRALILITYQYPSFPTYPLTIPPSSYPSPLL